MVVTRSHPKPCTGPSLPVRPSSQAPTVPTHSNSLLLGRIAVWTRRSRQMHGRCRLVNRLVLLDLRCLPLIHILIVDVPVALGLQALPDSGSIVVEHASLGWVGLD